MLHNRCMMHERAVGSGSIEGECRYEEIRMIEKFGIEVESLV